MSPTGTADPEARECPGSTPTDGYDALCAGETLCVWTPRSSYVLSMEAPGAGRRAPDRAHYRLQCPRAGVEIVDYHTAVGCLVDLPPEYVIVTPDGEIIEGARLGFGAD